MGKEAWPRLSDGTALCTSWTERRVGRVARSVRSSREGNSKLPQREDNANRLPSNEQREGLRGYAISIAAISLGCQWRSSALLCARTRRTGTAIMASGTSALSDDVKRTVLALKQATPDIVSLRGAELLPDLWQTIVH